MGGVSAREACPGAGSVARCSALGGCGQELGCHLQTPEQQAHSAVDGPWVELGELQAKVMPVTMGRGRAWALQSGLDILL